MPTVVYTVLHETPVGACISYIYRERAYALYAAENAARQTVADMRTADAASRGAYVGSGIYAVVVEDQGGRAELSIVHPLARDRSLVPLDSPRTQGRRADGRVARATGIQSRLTARSHHAHSKEPIMSRRRVTACQPGYAVVVGWDNPLSTFYATVTREQDADDDTDPVVLWLGGYAGEVRAPEDMVQPLAPYADLTQEVVAHLRADRAACADRGPTGLQRSLLAQLGRAP